MRLGYLPLAVALVLMLILPWVFADMMRTALLKLQIASQIATFIVAGILIGSLINVPVKRIEREELVPVDPFALFGLWRVLAGNHEGAQRNHHGRQCRRLRNPCQPGVVRGTAPGAGRSLCRADRRGVVERYRLL
jgi:hypothetical protein